MPDKQTDKRTKQFRLVYLQLRHRKSLFPIELWTDLVTDRQSEYCSYDTKKILKVFVYKILLDEINELQIITTCRSFSSNKFSNPPVLEEIIKCSLKITILIIEYLSVSFFLDDLSF